MEYDEFKLIHKHIFQIICILICISMRYIVSCEIHKVVADGKIENAIPKRNHVSK